MNIGFSATTLTFYDMDEKAVYIQNGFWSDDVISISQARWQQHCGQPPPGKIRAADNQGLPCWRDAPAPTEEERIAEAAIKKNEMLLQADTEIRRLQVLEELHVQTEEETQRLLSWKRHLASVYRIAPEKVGSIHWPDIPE